jgi:adenosylhomocysteine nucleosidase
MDKKAVFKGGLLALLCLACFLLPVPALAQQAPAPITALLGALDAEVVVIEQELTAKEEQRVLGLRFVTGELRGRKVVVVKTGVGKVNAAMTATLLLDHFRPKEVVFSGIAGAINHDLQPGDIVIGEKTAQHDYGDLTATQFVPDAPKNPVNGQRNPVQFLADERLLQLADTARNQVTLEKIPLSQGERVPRITRGIIVTGDMFIMSSAKKSELQTAFHADAVEMEGAAVAQICYQQNVPCLIIRSLSDGADEKARVDFNQFKPIAAKNSATLVLKMVELLAQQERASTEKK